MSKSNDSPGSSPAKQYRFGLRWLLVLVLVFATMFGWFSRASFQVSKQTQLLGDLAQLEVRVRDRVPTGLALLVRKVAGENDAWLSDRLSDGWLWQPGVLVTWTMTDEHLPAVVNRMKLLDTVREFHIEESPVTPQGIALLKSELPDVMVLTRADLRNQGPAQPVEHFAIAALECLAIVGAGVLGIVIVLLWPFRRW